MLFHKKPKVDPLTVEPEVCPITKEDVDRANERHREVMEALKNAEVAQEMAELGDALDEKIPNL